MKPVLGADPESVLTAYRHCPMQQHVAIAPLDGHTILGYLKTIPTGEIFTGLCLNSLVLPVHLGKIPKTEYWIGF